MNTEQPRFPPLSPPSLAVVDDLLAEIERALQGKLPVGLREYVAGIRTKAAAMFPPNAESKLPKELAALAGDLNKDLDTLEDILEAFVLFPSPPKSGP